MSDILGVASNAVAAYQRALSTTSNNIANVSTVGYSRETANFAANPVTQTGNIFMGTGVAVERITRQYNAFVEANLRNSNSDLTSQEPMVNYANRVVDIMGGESMSLNTALDQFYSSVRNVSTDPASTVLRSSFVRDAQGVADRFGQLSAQLDSIQEETSQAVQGQVEQVNSLSKQLAMVNSQLTKQRTADAQPPGLLDQRDQLLREMSDLAHVNTKFDLNGTVTVSLGPSITQDVVVSGNKSVEIGANFNSASPEKVALVLDPYGKALALSGPTSGSISGLMTFREQVLGSSRAALDNLAKSFAGAVNEVHLGGIDGYGEPAGTLFTFDPAASGAAGGMRVAFDDPMRVSAAAQFRVIEKDTNTSGTDATLLYDPSISGTSTTADGKPIVRADDISKVFVNNAHPSAGHTVSVASSVPIQPLASVARGMQDVSFFLDAAQSGQNLNILTRDGRALVGGSLSADMQEVLMTPANGFAEGARYSEDYLNVSGTEGYRDIQVFYGAQATVRQQPVYNSKDEISRYDSFPAVLQGNRIQTGQTAAIPADAFVLNGVALGALDAPSNGASRQASDLANWINAKTYVNANALVDTVTINGQAVSATDSTRLPITVEMHTADGTPSIGGESILNMAMEIGGQTIDTSAANGLSGLVAAINLKSAATGVTASIVTTGKQVQLVLSPSPNTGVTASAYNEIRIPPNQIRLSMPLSISGVDIASYQDGVLTPALGNAHHLAAAINDHTSETHVAASVTPTGELVISNAAGYEGEDITIDSTYYGGAEANALSLTSGVYGGSLRLTQPVGDAQDGGDFKALQLTFGRTGTPYDLARLGFRTQASIHGANPDDLLVFVSGAGTASVAASYAGTAADPRAALRAQSLIVTFSRDPDSGSGGLLYTITDKATGTEVASRAFDATQLAPGLDYQGLQLTFTKPPAAGDVFTMDGNQDGVGNNDNAIALAALENKHLVGNKTVSAAYIDHVNEMGNIARQATIAQTALTVVHEQAVASRDELSGVSLDAEAADLIRFQQAYQAAAKVIQISGQLFDSVLGIR
ncbi:MAG: flagellar hook-associated protein FlgK [Betaproteobacteria bacterium]|nr:flagellar hook-associated protein FlgK [Betaproteobacteria bacterium]